MADYVAEVLAEYDAHIERCRAEFLAGRHARMLAEMMRPLPMPCYNFQIIDNSSGSALTPPKDDVDER